MLRAEGLKLGTARANEDDRDGRSHDDGEEDGELGLGHAGTKQ